MEIFNVKEQLGAVSNDFNKDELKLLEREFRRKHYPNVLSKSKQFRQKYKNDRKLSRVLLLLEVICHSEINEFRQASEIILDLYRKEDPSNIDNLFLLAELAFMSDFKLSRRIMSDTIKRMEAEEDINFNKLARGYLVLGEAEENLEKFLRAIKYYKNGLMFYKESESENKQMLFFLHFKIGLLYSKLNKPEDAINHLKHATSSDNEDTYLKVNSLVSIAKIYGSQDKMEEAFPNLKEALAILDKTPEMDSYIRSEANMEMAYYYFGKEMYIEAIPYYEKALDFHQQGTPASPSALGMVYMQYAYCLEYQGSNNAQAAKHYEKAIEQLEKTGNDELIESALMSVISFFDKTNNKRNKKVYENKLMASVNKSNIS